jgi:hypothetical protein
MGIYKMKLLSILGLLSFSTLASEELDLSRDATYYCPESVRASISPDNKITNVGERNLYAELKNGRLSLTKKGNYEFDWSKSKVSTEPGNLLASDFHGQFSMVLDRKSHIISFFYYTYKNENRPWSLSKRTQKVSRGTCTLLNL